MYAGSAVAVSPRLRHARPGRDQLLRLAGSRLPDSYARRLVRYRYGPGVFKLDWALNGPIPWTAPEVARACDWLVVAGDVSQPRQVA